MRFERPGASFSLVSLVVLACVAPSVVARAQTSDPGASQQIEKALSKEKIKLSVSKQGGTVTLKGEVRNVFQKDRAVEIALAQPDVESVDTDVEVASAESDQKLGEAVVKELRKYSRFTVFDDASAYVQKGNVVLSGWVTEPYKKTELEKRLYGIIGIQNFKNDLEVLSNSMSDENLRQVLAHRLYSDTTFSDFASMPIPPIHIIVQGSRVILTGAVSSQLMKQKAESIIRQTPGVLSVESRLRVGG
jgi:osmotically-inducible protein OsmY